MTIQEAYLKHGFRAYSRPWEFGVEPDAANEKADFYLIPFYTRYIRRGPAKGSLPEGLGTACVLRGHNRETDECDFIATVNGKAYPLAEPASIDALAAECDKIRLALMRQE